MRGKWFIILCRDTPPPPTHLVGQTLPLVMWSRAAEWIWGLQPNVAPNNGHPYAAQPRLPHAHTLISRQLGLTVLQSSHVPQEKSNLKLRLGGWHWLCLARCTQLVVVQTLTLGGLLQSIKNDLNFHWSSVHHVLHGNTLMHIPYWN